MCEALGTTPVESEIPVDMADFPEEIRQAIKMWHALPDDIDHFNGGYYGKKLHYYKAIFELYDIPKEDYLHYYNWVFLVNTLKVRHVQDKKRSAPVKASPT